MLIYSPVHATPHTGDLHLGLVHEPPIPDTVTARSSCFDQFRREALHPPADNDVINFDTAFSEEFFHVTA